LIEGHVGDRLAAALARSSKNRCNIRGVAFAHAQLSNVLEQSWDNEEAHALTIPKRVRIYFRFDRRLLADLARAAARAITDVVRVVSDRPEGAPGIILALKTFN